MSEPNLPSGVDPSTNLQLQGGAAIVAPVSAFPGGVPGNALIVLPLSKPSDELLDSIKKGPVALEVDQMWKMLGFNGPAVQVQDAEGRPIAIGLEDLLLEGGQRSLRRWRPVLFLEVNKQYYRWRGVSLAERLAALLPENYLTLKSAEGKGERWQEIPNVDACERLDNVFIVPKERALQVLQQLG